ncbi:trypsin 5G1-like isoform X1 [Nasonia vitripennis]|uniref:Peptidase S1 domain-containing protein n=1 Tax=Nasonia vitripennis TaxID=7425 RepID=A0A7M7QSF9_NASVI|nr:trypsin 5G1-like isoform X1 [Nasonia vitripennis]
MSERTFYCQSLSQCRTFEYCSLLSASGRVWASHRTNRIVGGKEVNIEEHAYQLTFQQSGRHLCGASIISRKWAVTAGHCVGGRASTYRVGAGSSHRYNGTFHNVSEIVRHPEYDFAAIDYDIALIKIDDEFSYGSSVRPIQLPERDLQGGEVVNITGWGAVQQLRASKNVETVAARQREHERSDGDVGADSRSSRLQQGLQIGQAHNRSHDLRGTAEGRRQGLLPGRLGRSPQRQQHPLRHRVLGLRLRAAQIPGRLQQRRLPPALDHQRHRRLSLALDDVKTISSQIDTAQLSSCIYTYIPIHCT